MSLLKPKKITNKQKQLDRIFKPKKRISLDCKICHNTVYNLPPDTSAVTCSNCMVLSVEPPPEIKKKESTGRPRGWQFMNRYVSPEGIVYEKGKEIGNESLEQIKEPVSTKKEKSRTTKKRGGDRHTSDIGTKRARTAKEKTRTRNASVRSEKSNKKTTSKRKSVRRVSKRQQK
jgi:hypothetical protein